jgi:DNA repair protein RadC
VEGGKLLDIKVVDHLIVTPDGYYSFADEGLM